MYPVGCLTRKLEAAEHSISGASADNKISNGRIADDTGWVNSRLAEPPVHDFLWRVARARRVAVNSLARIEPQNSPSVERSLRFRLDDGASGHYP